MMTIPFILQILALIALGLATIGKPTVFGKIHTLPLGLFLWLLSLMLSAVILHPIKQ